MNKIPPRASGACPSHVLLRHPPERRPLAPLRDLLGSSVLAVGPVPGLDALRPELAARMAQDPICRERAAAELVRDATRMLALLAAGPASPLDLYRGGIARAPMAARQDPVRRERETGPLRHGNPRGNPNLAPRCGAKTRLGCPCKGPAMANGRCRMHGGKAKGAPKGNNHALKHGRYTTERIAERRRFGDLLREMTGFIDELEGKE